ncbi:MAG: zinc-binding dehydrogenase, partial [Dehalococcoidia bacterium]
KLFNARPIAVAASDEKLALAQRLGAEYVINRKTQDVYDEVRRITDRRGVDIAFEHPGEATWAQSLRCVRWGGTIVTSGATAGYEATTDLRHIFFRQLNVLGSTLGSKAELMEAWRHVISGQIRPVVSQVLPLSEAPRAQSIMESDEVVGKIVLMP